MTRALKSGKRQSQTMLSRAYEAAREILDSSDGAGFRFVVTLSSGKEMDVIPLADDDLDFKADGYYSHDPDWVEFEDADSVTLVRPAEIASIKVYRV